MNTSTTVLSIATLGLTGACAHLFYQAEVERERAHTEAGLRIEQQARITELEQDRAGLERQLNELNRLVASLQTEALESDQNEPPVVAASPPLKPPASSEAVAVEAGPAEGRRFNARRLGFLNRMLNDPAARASLRAQQTMGMRSMYGDFVRESNMTPEEAERFIELLVDQQMRTMEASQRFAEDATALTNATNEIRSETNAELLALLGGDRLQQYEKYPESMGDRMQIRQLRDQLDFTGAPLRTDQASQLLAVMQEERDRSPRPAPVAGTPPEQQFEAHLKWMDDYDRRLRERVAQVLTSEQLDRFVEMQQQQANMRRMGARMRREAMESGGSTSFAVPGVPVAIMQSTRP